MNISADILNWRHADNAVMMHTFLTLAAMSEGTGVASFSVRRLAQKLRIDDSKLRRVIDTMIADGLLQKATQDSTQKMTHLTFCKYVSYDRIATQEMTQEETQLKTHPLPLPLKERGEDTRASGAVEVKSKTKTKKADAFVKPSEAEVAAYMREYAEKKGIVADAYGFTAEEWVAHYESNGWKVGNNKMKNWKAAVRTWFSKRKQYSNNNIVRTNGTPNYITAAERSRQQAVRDLFNIKAQSAGAGFDAAERIRQIRARN